MADMVREYKLKPCPFCGAEAEINMLMGTYFVSCSICHAGIIPHYEEMSLDKVVEEWNRRVTDENKWIKCSERLPEKEGEYLTTIGKSHPVVRALFYGDPFAFPKPTEWFFYCEHGYGIDRFKAGTEVIAWMPMPDPIEEENDG